VSRDGGRCAGLDELQGGTASPKTAASTRRTAISAMITALGCRPSKYWTVSISPRTARISVMPRFGLTQRGINCRRIIRPTTRSHGEQVGRGHKSWLTPLSSGTSLTLGSRATLASERPRVSPVTPVRPADHAPCGPFLP